MSDLIHASSSTRLIMQLRAKATGSDKDLRLLALLKIDDNHELDGGLSSTHN